MDQLQPTTGTGIHTPLETIFEVYPMNLNEDAELESLRADLQLLAVEIAHVGPPEPECGPFAPDTEYERLIMRWYKTRHQLAQAETRRLNRALLDNVRTLLALESITDSPGGVRKHPKGAYSELTGLKVETRFDEMDLSLRRTRLQRELARAVKSVVEDVL